MNKTAEDVKEGVRKCLSGVYCNMNCPYAEFGRACQDELQKDTLEYIESLETKVAEAGKTIQNHYEAGFVDGFDACRVRKGGVDA
jgi:hypothetical protein